MIRGSRLWARIGVVYQREHSVAKRRKAREPYEPPRVRKIKLVPDELAVTGCKSTPVGGSQILCRRGAVIVSRTIGS